MPEPQDTISNAPEAETILYAYPLGRQPKGRDDVVLWGFYPSLFVCRITHGRDKEYYKVKITSFEGSEDEALYWAWWNNEREEFRHVYYFKDMVQMCFTYELKIYEEKGEGMLTPVNVDIIQTYSPDDPDERG